MSRGRVQRGQGAAIVLAVLAAGGCGGGSSGSQVVKARASGTWPDAVCLQVARNAAREGEDALRHYRPPLSNYPPDVALQGVRLSVGGLERHRCAPEIAGGVLSRRLTRSERAELFSHLPPRLVRYYRLGLAGT